MPQIVLTQRARAILLVFEKFTCAYLFQICTRNDVITYTNSFSDLAAFLAAPHPNFSC